MRFTITRELSSNSPLRLLVTLLLTGMLLFLGLDIFNHAVQLGSSMADIEANILGDEALFIEPLPLSSLLQMVHIDLFFSLILLFLLAIVYIRVSHHDSAKAVMINILFVTASLSHVALFSITQLGSIMIGVWLGLFLFWHGFAVIMIVLSVKGLFGDV